MTIRYQIQEMLRAERTYEEAGIQDELDAYNPLVPDGANWKATLMIEYPDVEERHRMLARLVGIEDRVWVQIGGEPRVYAIADEDLERDTVEKTSAVHFLRFELAPGMVAALKSGAPLALGVDHPEYIHAIGSVAPAVRASLLNDLAG
jgi:precorrin-3B methylase